MSQTFQFPREQWTPLLRLLGDQLSARPIVIEVIGRRGDQQVSQLLPFRGIAQGKGSEEGSLEITVGDEGDELTHRIANPTNVYVQLNDDGVLEWVAIEAQDDELEAKTLLHVVRLPALPAEAEAEA
jgi:hypothetical protein